MKLKKGILFLTLATLIFLFLKESGFYSNLLPNFTSVCLGSFLLPEDQRITVDNIVNDYIRIGFKSSYELESRILSLRPFSCFLIDRYIALKNNSIAFTDIYHPDQPPNIYSVYPLKSMKYLTFLELPLAKGANGDLKPLENLTELEYLILSYDNQKLDLSPLKKLKKLKSLRVKKIANGAPVDFNSIPAELPNLKSLSIEDPDFVDIESVSSFQNLEKIYLITNPSANFTPLQNLKRLKVLYIWKTKGAKCPNLPKDICFADQ